MWGLTFSNFMFSHTGPLMAGSLLTAMDAPDARSYIVWSQGSVVRHLCVVLRSHQQPYSTTRPVPVNDPTGGFCLQRESKAFT